MKTLDTTIADVNTLGMTITERNAIALSAMRGLRDIEFVQVSGGQSTESILDRCGGGLVHHNG